MHRGEMFASTPWTTGYVVSRTVGSAECIGLEIVFLPDRCDVDEADGFRCLRDKIAGRLPRFSSDISVAAKRNCVAAMAVPVT